MAQISSCPFCAESERLRGRAVEGDIEVTCESCGARWLRGAPRCGQCGGSEVEVRPQLMTRQPRGNQVAIVARREVPLCPRCDADALVASVSGNRTVPEGYVSAFLFGGQRASSTPASSDGHEAAAPSRRATRRPTAPRQTRVAERDHSAAPVPETKGAPATAPTVRQAVEAYLTSAPDADSLTLVLLGQHLGPSTRLDSLGPEAADRMQRWFQSTWGSQPASRRDHAAVALVGAIAHWRQHGWLSTDLTAGLR